MNTTEEQKTPEPQQGNPNDIDRRTWINTAMHAYRRPQIQPRKAMSTTPDITCPFCGETDFDLEGLSHHLHAYCEKAGLRGDDKGLLYDMEKAQLTAERAAHKETRRVLKVLMGDIDETLVHVSVGLRRCNRIRAALTAATEHLKQFKEKL